MTELSPTENQPTDNLLADNLLTENQQTEAVFHQLLVKVVEQESKQSIHFKKIAHSLIKFLKFRHLNGLELDFTDDQVTELALIFQNIIKEKNLLIKHLLELSSNLRSSQTLDEDELKSITRQIACMDEFSACINLFVVAERLSSEQVRIFH